MPHQSIRVSLPTSCECQQILVVPHLGSDIELTSDVESSVLSAKYGDRTGIGVSPVVFGAWMLCGQIVRPGHVGIAICIDGRFGGIDCR